MITTACCLAVGLGLRLGSDKCLVSWWLCTRICTTFRCDCHSPEIMTAVLKVMLNDKIIFSRPNCKTDQDGQRSCSALGRLI